jgi:hypothetical protein
MTLTLALQIVTIGLIVLVPLMLYKTSPSKWAVIGCVVYTVSYFISNGWQIALWTLEPPQAYGLALRLYQAGSLLLVATYGGITLYALFNGTRMDLQAKLVWVVLVIAEGFAFLEYVECKMFRDPFGSDDFLLSQIWGIEVSRFACGRAFGSVTPYAAPVVTSLYAIWVNVQARRIKEGGGD